MALVTKERALDIILPSLRAKASTSLVILCCKPAIKILFWNIRVSIVNRHDLSVTARECSIELGICRATFYASPAR